MRISSIALLAASLLLLSTLMATPATTSGQSLQIEDATTKLDQALIDVQAANSGGVSEAKVSNLTSELNTALGYRQTAVLLYGNGNLTGSDYYASLSSDLSGKVSAEAKSYGVEASQQNFLGRMFDGLVIELAATVSALAVVDFHRVVDFLRKRRMPKTTFG